MAPDKPLTADDLVRLFNTDPDVEGLLAMPDVRQALARTRQSDSRDDQLRVAKALMGIRVGRPKGPSYDPQDVPKMRVLKTRVQRALTRVRRTFRRADTFDQRAYQRAIEIDVLAPLVSWGPDRQRQMAAAIADWNMRPVQAATRVVVADFRVRASGVHRIGRARLQPPRRQSVKGRPARKRQSTNRRQRG